MWEVPRSKMSRRGGIDGMIRLRLAAPQPLMRRKLRATVAKPTCTGCLPVRPGYSVSGMLVATAEDSRAEQGLKNAGRLGGFQVSPLDARWRSVRFRTS